MANAPTLDFNAFVARKKAERAGGAMEGEHDYSYILDRQTRADLRVARSPSSSPSRARSACSRQSWRGQLLGNAVKVSERQFPRIHGIAQRVLASTLGIVAAAGLHRQQPAR